MKIEELKEGMKRILDAANEKLNNLCEEVGIEPDDPVLTDEGDENEDDSENGENGENPEASNIGDENTMPIPQDGAEQQQGAEAGNPDIATLQQSVDAMNISPEAQQVNAQAPTENMPVEGGQGAEDDTQNDENKQQ